MKTLFPATAVSLVLLCSVSVCPEEVPMASTTPPSTLMDSGDFRPEANVRHGEGRVWIEGVDKLCRANREWRENSVMRTLSICMQAAGEDASYDYLMGASGLAFRLHVHKDLCPSSPHAYCGYNVRNDAFAAMPRKMALLSPDQNDGWEAAKARKAITNSIDRGIPVTYGQIEDGVLWAYEDGGDSLLGRSYFRWHEDQPAQEMEDWPCGFAVAGDSQPLDRRQVLIHSLELARRLWETPAFEDYYSGKAAYDHWLEALQDPARYDEFGTMKDRDSLHGNGYIYLCLQDARRAAVAYLKMMEPEAESARPHLVRAAAAYQKMLTLLDANHTNAPLGGWVKDPSEWTPEKRAAEARALGQARRLDQQAQDELQLALAKLQGE